MSEVREVVAEFLEEYPEHDDIIEELVMLDTEGAWTFDDVPCDSGSFGEIVSREFVKPIDDGYRLVDREATMIALREGPSDQVDSPETDTDDMESTAGFVSVARSILRRSDRTGFGDRVRAITDVNLPFITVLLATLVFLFIMRAITFRSVFREKFVVFPGNDPYHYRHHVDQLLTASPGLLDFPGISDALGGLTIGEPFTYVLGWWMTRLVEGTPGTSGFALAWLPVVAAMIVGVLVAWMALAVTEDERIAVLSVLAFSLTPAHALYSGIGFFDHHAVDYVWLTLMAAALVWLARAVERRGPANHLRMPGTWLVAVVFGLACAAAMMTWNGAPLLLLGLVLYAVVRPASAVRTDNSPLRTSLPLVVALTVAAGLTHLLHRTAGWQEPAVVYAPTIVLLGVVGIALFGELVDRRDGKPWWVLGGSIVVGFVGTLGTRIAAPSIFERLMDRFTGALLGRDSAVETQSLFAPELGLSFNPIEYFGLLLLFALPALVLATWQCIEEHEPRWLVPVSYGWATFALTFIQIRFAGQLSPFSSLFAGVGLVWALSRVDLCRPPGWFEGCERISLQFRESIRNIDKAVYLSFALVIVVAVGIVVTIAVLGSVAIDGEQYETAAWIADDDREGSGFVLSHWGRNRMYNYFSWGGGSGYAFAQSSYDPFLASDDPDEWYGWLTTPRGQINDRDGGSGPNRPDGATARPAHSVDYVVFDEQRIGQEFPYEAWINAVGHYRLVYLSDFGRVSVFKTVEGATVTGRAAPGTTVDIMTDIEVSGYEYTYTRETTVDEDGEFAVRVAYPGTYTIGNRTVDVSATDVATGESVSISQSDE